MDKQRRETKLREQSYAKEFFIPESDCSKSNTHLYLIIDEFDRLKVGVSSSPYVRAHDIHTKSRIHNEVLYIGYNAGRFETEILEAFKGYISNGEWLMFSQDVITLFDRMWQFYKEDVSAYYNIPSPKKIHPYIWDYTKKDDYKFNDKLRRRFESEFRRRLLTKFDRDGRANSESILKIYVNSYQKIYKTSIPATRIKAVRLAKKLIKLKNLGVNRKANKFIRVFAVAA